ncbi:MAG TPA: class I SAM-dependent methyltransferase [Thermoplasmata archaeon]|nr:class I SAM-dependent methyltransferase [Thermoplasmata archaeon]
MSWGCFHVPEKDLGLLRDTRGKDVLELGCGAARWSIALARGGAHVVGVDLSPRRLVQARTLAREAGVSLTLVEASAESVPLPDQSFDLVFCDFGAMTFADPFRTVPEAARLLRPGGQLVFNTWSPIHTVYLDVRNERVASRPQRDYFRMHRVEWSKSVEFQLPYGAWIQLFLDNGFELERLVELPAPAHLRSSYMSAREARWGRTLPLEAIWSLRRRSASRAPKRRARPGRS